MLVIDDNTTAQDVLSRLAFSSGHVSSLAGNGFVDETLFLIGPHDLLIVHLQMPLTNVLELSRIFEERSQRDLPASHSVHLGAIDDKPCEKPDMSCVDAKI